MPDQLICSCGSAVFKIHASGKIYCFGCKKEVTIKDMQEQHKKDQDKIAKEDKKMITSYSRGHQITYRFNQWLYTDTMEPIKNNERSCIKCECYPDTQGHDACLGNLAGISSACCGHGISKRILQ